MSQTGHWHNSLYYHLEIALLSLFLLSVSAIDVSGQGGARGAINGTVKDQNGAAISKASIEIANQDTGVIERTVTANSEGFFTATLLPIGNYKVIVTASGFAKAEATNLKVNVTEITNVSITMKVGAVTEVVTVQDAATQVQLATPATGQTVNNVEELPLSTRNFLFLLALSSGANGELPDSGGFGRGQVSVNVNGQRPVNNNFQLEGINANDINLPIFDNVPVPNPETVEEFKTQTSLYDASQGRNGGGNIQAILKAGTNKFHGNAYEFFRNDALNANDFFLNRVGRARPVLKQNQFGGSIGGPLPSFSIFKDMFFFGNYQGTRQKSGFAGGTLLSTTIVSLPTDRSEASLRARFFPAGLPSGFTFLNPVALKFLNLPASKCPVINDGKFCIPSAAAGPSNLVRSSVGDYTDDQFVVTIDKQYKENDKFTGRWFFSNNALSVPFGIASSLSFRRDAPGLNRFLKLGWTHTFSPRMVNDLRFGFNRFGFALVPTEPILLTDIGATRGNSGEIPAAYRINVGGAGGFTIGTGVNDDRGGRFNTFVVGDDLSLNVGSHQFRFGGEMSRYQLNRFNRFATRGNVTFGNTGLGAGGSGIPPLSGIQNFLLGRITTTQGGAGFFTFYFRATDVAAYVHDDWKINSRMTLNLGVRWEGLSVASEKQNFLSNFQGLSDGAAPPIKVIHPADTPRVGTPGVSSCTLLSCFDKNNFAPRLGLAIDVFGNQKTSLRAGYGIYYQRTSNQPLLQTSGGLPFSQPVSASAFSVTTQNPFPSIRPTSDFPLPFDQIVPGLIAFDGASGAPIFNSASGGALGAFFFQPERSFRSPYGQQWNLTIQQQMFKNWIFEVGYVGTRGIGLVGTGRPLNPGQICTAAKPCKIPSVIGSGVTVPAGTPGTVKNADGSITITSSTLDNVDARVPAQFIGLANNRGFFQEQSGASTYHSLQTSLSHRFSSGLFLLGAYTFAKSIDNSSGSIFGDELNGLVHLGDLFDLNGNRGLSDFDRTHRATISYAYELPFARLLKIENKGFGKLVSGWAINGITVFQSGNPFQIVDNSGGTLQDPDVNNGNNKTDLAPGRTLQSALTSGNVRARLDSYIDLTAFTLGTSDRCVNDQNIRVSCSSPSAIAVGIGSIGRGVFRGPFQQNWDLSLIKRTTITESTALEFRAEFFNVWNHASFLGPQSGGIGSTFGGSSTLDVSTGLSAITGTANKPRIMQFALKLSF